jgi:hypothetical protein
MLSVSRAENEKELVQVSPDMVADGIQALLEESYAIPRGIGGSDLPP